MGRFTVGLDGSEVSPEDIGSRKARTLLKLLAVDSERLYPIDALTDAIWGSHPPERPADNLATLVSRLRARLGADVVQGNRSGWRLGESAAVDLDVAARLVGQARICLEAGDAAVAVVAGQNAERKLTGDVLPDEPAADWVGPARTRAVMELRQARHLTAQAALEVDDPSLAAAVADRALGADPLDEQAARLLMRAQHYAGEPGRALATFEALRAALADELGADPGPPTRALHLAILTETEQPHQKRVPAPRRVLSERAGLVGRGREWEFLSGRWSDAVDGRPAVVLLTGEGGIGKTRVAADFAAAVRETGGAVLEARCYDTERALFLQPLADAVRPVLVRSTPSVVREIAGDRAAELASLIPEVADVLGPVRYELRTPEIERRLAYEAVIELLTRLSARDPVLLVLDDLQNAGLATFELLHLLARRSSPARILVVATVRTEDGEEPLRRLGGVAQSLDLGPLDAAAVQCLADTAGLGSLGQSIAARTGGHALFVVETLRSISIGDEGVPASLNAAVLSRVARLDADVQEILRAAAVLGPSVDPRTVAAMLGKTPVDVLRGCEELVGARLAVAVGAGYEFANDLVRDVIYATTPLPVRHAFHRLAADLLADRPEAQAPHAVATEQWARAGRAWLAAGNAALSRFAAADAERLLDQALEAAERMDSSELRIQALLDRGRVREVLGRYEEALEDFRRGLELADENGDEQSAMLLHRELGGDSQIAVGRPVAACVSHLDAGLRIAERLDDDGAKADMLSRLAILSCSRMDFLAARSYGQRAAEAGRRTGDPNALRLGLDGLKISYAYVGDVNQLRDVVAELEPLARRAGDLLIAQWTVFERSLVGLAAGRWAEATETVEEALALNRRSGRTNYEGWFIAHLGWIARLAGRMDDAVGHGRRSVQPTDHPHSWWDSTACAMLAASLMQQDPKTHRAEAIRLLRRGLGSADRSGAEVYRLRCLAQLAEATGAAEVTEQADAMLRAATFPAGTAWLHGMDAYLALARAWMDAGRQDRAADVLLPLMTAGRAAGWSAVLDASGATALSLQCTAG